MRWSTIIMHFNAVMFFVSIYFIDTLTLVWRKIYITETSQRLFSYPSETSTPPVRVRLLCSSWVLVLWPPNTLWTHRMWSHCYCHPSSFAIFSQRQLISRDSSQLSFINYNGFQRRADKDMQRMWWNLRKVELLFESLEEGGRGHFWRTM